MYPHLSLFLISYAELEKPNIGISGKGLKGYCKYPCHLKLTEGHNYVFRDNLALKERDVCLLKTVRHL